MYPMYVVFFEMDPSKIDVNVHPTKQEIKFEDERLVYNYLRVAARHALAQYSITPSLDFEVDQSNAFEFNRFSENTDNDEKENEGISTFESRLSSGIEKLSGLNYDSDEKTKFSGSSFKFPTDKNSRENTNLKNWEKLYDGLLTEGEAEDEKRDEQDNYVSKIGNLNELEIVGDETYSVKQLFQIHNTYIISTLKSGFMLINQTAAHQRILYEDFLRRLELQEPLIQSKLFPTSIDLNPRDSEMLMGILPELNAMGIDIREFGKNCFVVHGLPAEMNDLNEQKLIEELIEQFQAGLALKLDVKHNLARVLAMQAATRQGVKLNQDEMQRIVDRLFSCSDPFTAPNGKKTFIRIELSELQRRFE
jgi:DNA mismatch repair protein MutL